MLNNEIPSVLKATYAVKEGSFSLSYDCTSKLSLRKFLQTNSTPDEIIRVLWRLSGDLLAADKYLVDINQCVNDLDYVFIDAKTREVSLVLLPIKRENTGSTRILIMQIVEQVNADDSSASAKFAQMVTFLNENLPFSIALFNKYLTTLIADDDVELSVPAEEETHYLTRSNTPHENEAKSEPEPAKIENDDALELPKNDAFEIPGQEKSTAVQKSAPENVTLFYLLTHWSKENHHAYKNRAGKKSTQKKTEAKENHRAKKAQALPHVQNAEANFGKTQILNENAQAAQTSCLTDACEIPGDKISTAVCIQTRTNNQLTITKAVFLLGRQEDVVDFAITDNTNISGVHASIEHNLRSDKWSITDTNSRNHVFLNGEQISPSEKLELKSGDTFKLADEEFRFEVK
jgi:hypothetical protein